MAHKENKGVKVRCARLEDAVEISGIHRSHVGRWYRRVGAEHVVVSYDNLTIGERWGFGGPWMSVETCAVHINNLLLQRQFPFVAIVGDCIVGEMEVFLGDEGGRYGKNLHVGLLYVLKSRKGLGTGSALADKAFELAESQGCDTVTVASTMANVGFYEKCGFTLEGTMVELDALTGNFDVDMSPLQPPLNMWSFTRGKPMPIGRHQSSAFHVFEQLDTYAFPEFLETRRDRAFVSINGHPSMLAFTGCDDEPSRAEVYAWSDAGAEDVTKAALTLLHRKGVRYATLLLAGDDYKMMAGALDAAVRGSRGSLLRRIK